MTQPYAKVVEREQELDSCLERPRVMPRSARALRSAALRWSGAVWAAAEAAGPRALDASQIARGIELARRPVFVCGAHRSGTTLLRDLLDGHPALAVLPSEGSYITELEPRLHRIDGSLWLASLATEWVRRLANPISREPYWLLGRSSPEYSPYVEFSRSLAAWWPLLEAGIGARVASWPLVAVALGYAQCAPGAAHSRLQRWVEKTPTNERFLGRLRAEFPAAKVIHVVRHPCAAYASHEQAWRNVRRRFPHQGQVLDDLERSYRIALEQSSRPQGDYLLIRYEELLRTPGEVVASVAKHLEIEPLESLLHPTAAGQPTYANSSFLTDAPPGRICPLDPYRSIHTLSGAALERIVSRLGEPARALGYELPAPPAPRRPLRSGRVHRLLISITK